MFQQNLTINLENFIPSPHSKKSEPPPGFEPGTYALRVRCSTPELRRRCIFLKNQADIDFTWVARVINFGYW